MTIFNSIKKLFISEAIPKPVSKIVNSWNVGDAPDVSFKQLMEYHDKTPQISVGVVGYSKLIDLSNIQINSDDDKAKKIIEDWNMMAKMNDKLESMCNTLLICGNAILEKLDDAITQDVAEVDMSTIIDKKRDEYGNTLYYVQQGNNGTIKLGETKLNKFIEFNLTSYGRKAWSPCIFHSLTLSRNVRGRSMMPLVEVLWGIEDAMGAIILNNAYPITYVTFEGANEDELNKEAEKIRKRKPGDTHIVTKKPQLDIYETQPASKYTDYINHIEKTIQLGIKFPSDILTGDFTSRASSQTTEDLTLKIARGFQRYIGNKLKIELYDHILIQNGIDPKKANLSVTFSTQNIIQLTPESLLAMSTAGKITTDEFREWLGDNTGIDLFDKIDDINTIPVPDKNGLVTMKPAIVKKEAFGDDLDFGNTIQYKLEYTHEVEDECDDYDDEVFDITSPDIPILPIHPNCKCYFIDEVTGDYLGQDPQMAVNGATPIIPESIKEIKKDIAMIKHKLLAPINESVTIRAKEIKEKFYIDTVEKAVKDSLKDAVEEVREIIEEKKFNVKAKNDILKKLNEIMGDNHGT